MDKFKYTSIIIFFTLIAGVFLGWLFFRPSGDSTEKTEASEEMMKKTTWTCSMHPSVRSNEPGDCPICGMELIKVDEAQGDQIDPSAIVMSPQAMQLADVQTTRVGALANVEKTILLNGKVQVDERKTFSQASHIPGRVEKLMVEFTGEYVKKNQVIASVYSPELVTAQEELLEAQKIKDTQPGLFKAAREKLKNWKLTNSQIDNILQNGETTEVFDILSDASGYVAQRKVNTGDYIRKGESLYEIADLSRVWLLFDVYETDMQWIGIGDTVKFTVASMPGENYSGSISYIDPVINPKTRIAKARVEMANPDLKLKPEMFISGTLSAVSAKSSDVLTVPKSAVMWTGKRSVVYVKSVGEDQLSFLMREVTLGPSLGNHFVLENGLEAGEEIVTNGTFSIDAAAQLAGKPSMMSPEGGSKMSGHNHGANTPEKTGSPKQTQSGQPKMSEAFFNAYLAVKDALVKTDGNQTRHAAREMLDNMGDHKSESTNKIKLQLQKMAGTTDTEMQREHFQPVSDLVYELAKTHSPITLYRQYCPMAFENEGAYWLSAQKEIRNPYFGDKMLKCGKVTETIE